MVSHITPPMVQKNKSRFVTFSLPKDIVDKVDAFIKNSKNSNPLYQHRPDVIKVALYNFFKDNNGGDVDGDKV